jgi:hypothetical protein
MASRLGRPNKDKQAIRDMAAQHGVDVMEIQMMICADLLKTYSNEASKPRSRRSKRFFEAEEKLMKLTETTTKYFHGPLSNVTITDETPRLTVIRAPEAVASSQDWLAKYGPKRDDMANEVPFVRNLRLSLNAADDLGIDDAGSIVDEAKKHTK